MMSVFPPVFFKTRLFLFFKKDSVDASFPEITIERKETVQTEPVLVAHQQDGPTAACLHMLHPQAHRFLLASADHSVRLYTLSEHLRDELHRTVWLAPAPQWACAQLENSLTSKDGSQYFSFQISAIHAALFPTDIIAVQIEIRPAFEITSSTVVAAGMMIINTLSRGGSSWAGDKFKSVDFERLFRDDRQRESIERRMGKNTTMPLITGMCGHPLSIGDIAHGILGTSCTSLMGDRYLSFSFLMTERSTEDSAFSRNDYVDLVRLARGESTNYLPHTESCQPGSNGILNTFDNIAFSLAAEGCTCWVKPHADQRFLQNQFLQRFETIYLQLYLLALHQRHALIDMEKRLEKSTPPLALVKSFNNTEDASIFEILKTTTGTLADLRTEFANFYLRYFYQQPAILTNHQAFYSSLQKELGIAPLLEEVQKETAELEYLMRSFHESIDDHLNRKKRIDQQNEHNSLLGQIKNLIHEQERGAKNEFTLTLVVEAVAIPYYSYMFLEHAFHCPGWLASTISIGLTVVTMGYTIYKLRRTKNR